MNRQRRQELAVRQLLRSAAYFQALPADDDLDELRMLRLPEQAIERVQSYAAAIADPEEPASPSTLQRVADLLAHDTVVNGTGPDDNTPTDTDRDEAASIRRQRSGGVKVTGDGGHVNVTVDRGPGPVSRSPERAPWAQ